MSIDLTELYDTIEPKILEPKIRVAIVGSRDFTSVAEVHSYMRANLNPQQHIIVSGGARGVDFMAGNYGRKHDFEVVEHLPDWEKHGRGAGLIRNSLIVDDCDTFVAFWDGTSRGTLDTIKKMGAAGKSGVVMVLQ